MQTTFRQIGGYIGMSTALLLAATAASAQQTSNYEMRAVPTPGQVQIDGQLNDWDLSGGIFMCYDTAMLMDKHSAYAYMMYDAEALYVALRFKDETPLINHVDPVGQPSKGWRADCAQIRLWTDRVLHVDAYYYTDKQQPAMHIAYNDIGVPGADEGSELNALSKGAAMAFQLDKDGKGYVQEIRLPWTLIRRDGQPMTAGDTFRCGLELFWGDGTGRNWFAHRLTDLINPILRQREFFWSNKDAWGTVRLMAEGRLPATEQVARVSIAERMAKLTRTDGPVPLRYELPADGYVTLVIERPDGARVRNLIANAPRKKGANVDYWDGADDSGRLVEPGEYRFRGLTHQGLDLAYQFAFYNPGNPPWCTVDGTGNWLADHSMAQAAAADEERIYIASPNAESGYCVMALDTEGRKRWGVAGVMPGISTAIAVDGEYLYVALEREGIPGHPKSGVYLYRVHRETGRFATFPDGKIDRHVTDLPPTESPFGFDWGRVSDVHLLQSRAAAIAAKSLDTDWLKQNIYGLAARQGKVYVPVHSQNVILVCDGATAAVLEKLPVEKPAGVAFDPRGNLLAISGRQLVRLDVATGEITPVVTDGLVAPVALAVDRKGDIYVSEWRDRMQVKVFGPDGTPRRTVGKTGGRPWVGAHDPAGMLCPRGLAVDGNGRLWVVEEDDTPRRLSVWNDDGQFHREFIGPAHYGGTGAFIDSRNPTRAYAMNTDFELDWEAGSYRVLGTPWRPDRPEAKFGPYGGKVMTDVVDYRGQRYYIHYRGLRNLTVSVRRGDRFHPFAAFGELITGTWQQATIINVLWMDRNGDGLTQDSEVSKLDTLPGYDQPVRLYWGWRAAVAPDLSLYVSSTAIAGELLIWKLPVARWQNELPYYDAAQAKLIVHDDVRWTSQSQWADRQGNILSIHSPLTMYSPDGQHLWHYPNEWPGVHASHRAPQARPGRLIGPLYVIGSATLGEGVGEIFCMNGNFGQAFLMTTDGLYIGELFRDARSGPDNRPEVARRGDSHNTTTSGGEWFGGFFFRNEVDGKVYIVNGGQAHLIHEVKGLETAQRLPTQAITFSRDDYAKAHELFAQRQQQAAAPMRTQLRRTEQPITVDGVPQEYVWQPDKVAEWSFDAARQAQVAIRYDDHNLYLCYRVKDDSPMVNSGQNWMLLFKRGDAVVFELGADDTAEAGRSTPVAGDMRLVLSVFQGEPVAVLYRYVVPGAVNPTPFTSPVGTTTVDEVLLLENAKIAVHRTADEYVLEAAVPLDDLGFRPRPGQRYRGDFGVIHSDRAGLINELRMYWANKATGIINCIFAESQIQPNMWGEIEVVE